MMQSQPQLSLNSYTEKSIVLRSNPIDFFKSYSQHLTQLGGKWNPNLKDPSGVGILGGWIFPKSKEAAVRNGVAQITSGKVQPQASYSSLNQGQAQTLSSLGGADTLQQALYGAPQSQQANSMQQVLARAMAAQPQQQTYAPPIVVQQPANSMQQLLSRAQSNSMASEPLSQVFTSAVPIGELPSVNNPNTSIPSVPHGYQQIVYIVIKPEVGQTLQLHYAGQKVPVVVEKVEVNNNITHEAIIRLPDGQATKIRLTNDQWSIPGYDQDNSISLF